MHQTAAAAIGDKVDDLGRQHHGRALGRMSAASAILNMSAGLQTLARLDQALPNVTQRVNILEALEQQRLDHAAQLVLRPIRRAGITRVWLMTSTSPGSI